MRTIEQNIVHNKIVKNFKEETIKKIKYLTVIMPIVFALLLTSCFWAIIAVFMLILSEKY